MLCGNCHKREAEVFFKQIVNNQLTQMALCRECAEEKGLAASAPNLLLDLMSTLGDILRQNPSQGLTRLQCGSCGLRYSQFMESGRLGCANCYVAFHDPIADLLKRIHGATRHVGKLPVEGGSRASPSVFGNAPSPRPKPPGTARELPVLRAALKAAIARENFEEAARLRDRIRELEGTA